ncbi:hypothetical protein ACIPRD_08030 [Streptomyces sp. NPDC090108]|uniref:hypothetical protein n=1 Tax=Streptomyces sp. NPDC090108 TaxID=3365947 RepID=UPI00382E82DF
MNDEDWRGFASAFHRAVRPDARPGQAVGRVLATGVAAVAVVTLGALLDGALGGGRAIAEPGDVKPIATPSRPAPGAQQAGRTWTAVAGPGCASDRSSSFTAYGYYTGTNSDQTTGWTGSDHGGYSGGSCTGGYLSIPVSGKAGSYDEPRFALWRFDFGDTFTSASCTLDTYIPRNSDRQYVGGDPAYYYYFQTDYSYGSAASPLGGYLVSQVSRPGQWVTGKAFKVRTGLVTVKLVDAGAHDSAKAANAHVAAAQVRITCNAV